MKVNAISYLGFMGFLGFLGPLTGNLGCYGFFGFVGFFSAFGGTGSDERIENNINRACRNSFIVIILTMSLTLAYIASYGGLAAFPLAFSILFIGSMVTFVASYIYYDRSGD